MDGLDASCIEESKSLLDESRKRKLIVEQREDSLVQLGASIKSDLYNLKLQFSQLKSTLRNEQVRYFLLVGLDDSDDNNSKNIIDSAPSDSELNDIHVNLSIVKEGLENSRDHIEDVADSLQTGYEEYLDKFKTWEELLEQQAQKKKRMEHCLDVVKDAMGKMVDLVGEHTTNNMDNPELQHVESVLKDVQAKTIQHGESFMQVNQSASELHSEIKEIRDIAEKLQSTRNIRGLKQQHRALTLWCEDTLKMLEELQGIHDHGLAHSTWWVSIEAPGDAPELNVKMTIAWKECNVVLKEVELDNDEIDTGSIILEAVSSNSIQSLLTNLRTLWLQDNAIATQIQQLRQTYAVDWEREKREVTVLFDSVSCVLYVPPGYPGEDHITLKHVTGHSNTQLLQPENPNCSLKEWIEHLQKKLVSS